MHALRSAPHRVLALLVVVAVAVAMTLYINRADAAITTPFGQEFGTNANGAILMRGNVNLVCPTAATGCTAAQGGSGSTTDESLNNNGYVMENVGADSANGIFNSSSAAIAMPANSTVLFAGLYWSANTAAGTSGAAAPTEADKNKVKFAVPGTPGWSTVTAGKVNVTATTVFQGFADVTSAVAGAGNGTYAVGNIQAGTGKDRHAGWALVIAYQNASLPMRDLRVYDGFGVVSNSSTSVDITVNGFLTPGSGQVTTKIGTVVYEGDLGKTGDALKLNGTAMTDGKNPADNFFNSTISEGGTSITDRTPNYVNTMGLDVDQFDATGKLANGATSATLTLTTSGETFYPGVVTFTTDLYAPDLTATLTGTDKTGDSRLMPGDVIEYSISVNNKGTDNSLHTVLTDAVPAGTTYVPGSLKIDGTAVTDASGDDRGEFVTDSAQGKTTFRLGTGATATAGGTLATGATTVVTYRVKVKDSTPSGSTITNVAAMSYEGEHTGRLISGTSNVVNATVDKPVADLSAAVTATPVTVQRDPAPATVTYVVTVTNNGTDREPLPVAKLTLPTGITVSSLPAGCTQSGQDITCALSALESGTSGTVTITATVGSSAVLDSATTVAVSGSGTDNTPGNNTATAPLRVNSVPQAGADTANTATSTAATINVLTNDSDADAGDTLTVAMGAAPAHGSAVVNADKTITYTPTTGWAGTDTFTYTVSDGYGGTATGTVTVNVDNAPPVTADDTAATLAAQPVTIDVLANDSDPNGDPKSVAAVTQPAGGTVTISGNKVVFTPNADFKGLATFTYTASDGRGGTTPGTVKVTVANAAPAASNDIATTPYLADVVINVLGNDTDANKDTLTITNATTPAHGTADITSGKITYRPAAKFSGTDTFSYTISDGTATSTATVTVTVENAAPTAADLTAATDYDTPVTIDWAPKAADANNDPLTIIGTTQPGHGTASVDGDGKLVYEPDTSWSGPDTFEYTVGDGRGGEITAKVTVTVANAAPIAGDDPVSAESNVPTTLTVLANDADPNGDPLTVTITTMPTHGTASVNPDGTIAYTPTAGYLGPDSLEYTITDGKGGTATALVTIAVLNSAPVAKPDSATTPTDTAVTLTVLDNDTDPNGDPISVTAFTNGAHGTVTLSGGNLIYVPSGGFAGVDTFTYTVGDTHGNTDTAVVTVTVQNANPIAVPDTAVAQPGTPAVLKVLANDTDPNLGQVLRLKSVTTPGKGKAVVSADGKTVTYTADSGASGTDTFEYTVTDDNGGEDTETVTITIRALPVPAPDNATTKAGTAVTVDLLGNDTAPAGGALTLVSVTQPKHGKVTLVDGKAVYTPEAGYVGTDTFTYVVRDASGGEATGTATVGVGNTPPVATSDQAAAARNGKTDIDVLANDTDVNTGQKLTVQSVSTPAHGKATIVDGKVRYVPDAGWTGTDTFTYVVGDGNGGTATGTVTVTVTGDAPVALPDSATTPYQQAVTVKVLANDLDPAGDPLTVTAVTQPEHGSVTFTGTSVRYTPPAGWSGTATFTYTITDGTATSTATVTVKVGQPPVVPDKSANAKPATPVSVTLPTKDEHGTPVTVTRIGKPAHGTAKLNADGTVTYVPEAGFAGADSFTYSAVDADGNVATGTIKVMVAGTSTAIAPKAKNDTASVTAGKSVIVQVRANDTNAATIVKVSKPAHGHAVINADGTITYAPDDSYAGGKDTFTYTISDGNGGTAKATVTVTVHEADNGTSGSLIKLPKTGADLASVGGVGILTLIVGAALFWFGGRSPAWLLAGGTRDRGPGRHRPGKHAA